MDEWIDFVDQKKFVMQLCNDDLVIRQTDKYIKSVDLAVYLLFFLSLVVVSVRNRGVMVHLL